LIIFIPDMRLLIKTPNMKPYIKKRLSLVNENKTIKRSVCAIFLVSEKSRKNEELKTVNRVTNNRNTKNILKKVFFIISKKFCLFCKITKIRNKQIIHILTKAFEYVINGIERHIKKPI
tara:strand:+ start:639 stop:995 length:357 start_codon:yes stop_codon:yes gene_type:complete